MVDLRTLSRNTEDAGLAAASAEQRITPPKRRWFSRIALPALIVVAVLALLGYAGREAWMPARAMAVVRAQPLPADAATMQTASDTPQSTHIPTVVAQAPGWVEPDPYPIYVSALADGVVERIAALEGESVQAGQLLVQMVDDDAQLDLAEARANLVRAQADLKAAETDLAEPVTLIRAQAVAEAKRAETRAARLQLDAQIAEQQARLAELTTTYQRLSQMTGSAVSAYEVDIARHQMQSQQARLEAAQRQSAVLEAQIKAAEAELHAARRDLKLKTELQRRRDEAQAAVDHAKVKVDEAQLRLERMTIASPVDGVVMERLVAPGDKLKLAMDGRHSAHAIHLYDPQSLQVRVDVPLADAAAVGLGQQAIVIVDVLPDVEFAGEVTRIVHQADIAKNTVQFKVAIRDPSPLLKPNMLARVKFLSGGPPDDSNTRTTVANMPQRQTRVAITTGAIVESDSDEPFVWWISPRDQRIERRAVTLGESRDGPFVEIVAGLNPGDMIVAQPDASLAEGERIRITGTQP